MINANISDPRSKKKVWVSDDNFLKVDNRDHYIYSPTARFFINETNGNNLAVNGYPGDLSEDIYDGNDNTYWTFSIISGVAGDFVESTDQNHTSGGTQSLDFSAAEDADTCQFEKPGGSFDLSGYSVLNGWIYLTSWADLTKNIFVYAWDTGANEIIGSSIQLSDYINIGNLNTWQSFTITLSDLGLSGQIIDAIRFEIEDTGPGSAPNGYLDDISFAGSTTGGPFEYILEPNIGETLLVHTLTYSLSQDYDNTLLNSNMPNLSWDKLLNVDLINGLLYRRYILEQVAFSANWQHLLDMLASPGATLLTTGSNGSSVFLTLNYDFAVPTVLDYKYRDKISIQISDNLSVLNFFRLSANCSIRTER